MHTYELLMSHIEVNKCMYEEQCCSEKPRMLGYIHNLQKKNNKCRTNTKTLL